ncbi:MAG: hypothetical protein H7A24_15500 [Leptospiraceae bacterium]|nr:hypothetical protein [Leptospiraceae bacterium]MCP5513291.1 hypothetical protein [Leptospiraceae bacterium]
MRKCPCGHDRRSPEVQEVPEYSLWSMFLISFGISATPTKVEFECTKCWKKFDSLSPEELKTYS